MPQLQQLKRRTLGVVAKVPTWENKGELASDFFFLMDENPNVGPNAWT